MIGQSLVIGYLVHWMVGEVVSGTAKFDGTKLKSEAVDYLKKTVGVHSAWLATELGSVVFKVIDVAVAVLEDEGDLEAILKDAAAKDWVDAEKTLVHAVVSACPELGPVLGQTPTYSDHVA